MLKIAIKLTDNFTMNILGYNKAKYNNRKERDKMPNDNVHQTANRLANEKSPYLLQHAHNPVDWFPWGEEAFDKAKKDDKPIFLSIGYS